MKLTAGLKSSEFWVALATGVALALWPDMPTESLYAAVAYVLSRGFSKWGNGGLDD